MTQFTHFVKIETKLVQNVEKKLIQIFTKNKETKNIFNI